MLALLQRFVDPSGLTPHGFCLAWEPGLIWLEAVSDILIAAAYYSIPLALMTFARRRRDLIFPWMFWLFAAFILACGTTHLLGALTLWVPAYWPDGITKAITAALSLGTAALLWPLIPKALALPSPSDLDKINNALRQEIAERDRMTRKLAESEARYRTLFDHAPVAMHSVDVNRCLLVVSNQWLELLGYRREEVIGRPLSDFQDTSVPSTGPTWREIMRMGGMRDVERRFVRKDGRVLDVLVSSTVETGRGSDGTYRSICILTDITERKRTEAALQESEGRLRRAEKLSALGQLAGGIAHDFNNILQAVQSGASLIRRYAANAGTVDRIAGMIEDTATRGGSITRRLLAFARRDELRAEVIEVPGLLNSLREMLAHTLGPAIAVQVEVAAALAPVLADRGQLETMLINLGINARDAMPEGGTLTIAAAAETVREAPHPAGPLPGDYVRLSMTDTGTGMDAQTLARATEPFFSTKPHGRGTGLGLALAKSVAEKSGGALTIQSSLGHGTSVVVWLPVATATATATGRGAAAAHEHAVCEAPAQRRARVLLVEDEAMVRAILAEQLRTFGYDVTQAESGETALALLEAGEQLDLMMSDLSMPGMSGIALIREVQKRRPGLPAILLTGYAGEAMALDLDGLINSQTFALLRKPIDGAMLANRAATLLEGVGSGARSAAQQPVNSAIAGWV